MGHEECSDAQEGFRAAVLAAYEETGRSLPWRARTDVYGVLVAELMLQQTQVPRVVPKYIAFLEQFPDAVSLRDAPLRDVLYCWQGLGYNRRAKYLWEASSVIAATPELSFEALRALPGIGPYTAAAVRVFAANEDRAATDVNVRRVFMRHFGRADDACIAAAVPRGRSRDWHNALMDFGSLVCTKRAPKCASCPVQDTCHAYRHGTLADEPSRSQGTFLGSVRWHRGRILALVLAGVHEPTEIWSRLGPLRDEQRFRDAVEQLVQEGLLTDTGVLHVS